MASPRTAPAIARGPRDASRASGAGAIVDGGTWARVGDAAAALAAHDSGRALAAAGDAITIGPTGINHADLVLIARPGVVVREGA